MRFDCLLVLPLWAGLAPHGLCALLDGARGPQDFEEAGATTTTRPAHDPGPRLRVLVLLLVDAPTPFLAETLASVTGLELGQHAVRLEVHEVVPEDDAGANHSRPRHQHRRQQRETVRRIAFRHRHRFARTSLHGARGRGIGVGRAGDACAAWSCDFLLYVEALVHVRQRRLLAALLEHNRTVIAPFAAALPRDIHMPPPDQPPGHPPGQEEQEADSNTDRVPPDLGGAEERLATTRTVRHIFLLRSDFFAAEPGTRHRCGECERPGGLLLPEAVERWAGERSVPLLVSRPPSATLVRRRAFQAGLAKRRRTGELWQVFENPAEWEQRYLHPGYHRARRRAEYERPCPDVFWIPLFSAAFCRDITDEMEAFGRWSLGKDQHMDSADEGTAVDWRRRNEDLPYATVDIYMWQVEFNTEYMWILLKYLYPVQLQVFPQHDDYPYSIDNFVVRYRLGEQVKLAPHFDESQITLNVALNAEGEDYRGGGTHFVRYDCSVVRSRRGWGLLHPNRPTHRHLGLELLNGTRYILVSFLDGRQYVEEFGKPRFEQ